MNMLERPIAVTDFETTGLRSRYHEIIDVGLVLIDPETYQPFAQYDQKVAPKYPERITEGAQAVNGFDPIHWATHGISLKKTMARYAELTEGAIFLSQNVTFDWAFAELAFEVTGVENRMDYHRIDLFTVAWVKFQHSGLTSYRLKSLAEHLGLEPEPDPHRAIHGAQLAARIYRELMVR